MTTKEKYSAIPKEERKRLAKEAFSKTPLLWELLAAVVVSVSLSRLIGNRLVARTAPALIHFSLELVIVAILALAISYFLLWPSLRAAVVAAHEKQ
jgi:hypothetical protein